MATTAPPEVDQAGRSLGGTLVYALETPATGLFPTESGCDVACRQILSAIADPLVSVDRSGRAVPYLLESLTTADDYFTWILTIRDGVTFHDGSAFDGAALADHLDRCRFSPLTSAWFAPIGAVEATNLTVTLHLEEPWLSFPEMLATHPCSFVIAGTPTDPIGTGPFRIESGLLTGDGLTTARFNDYWRGSSGTGEGLPLLDQIEFTVQPDQADRDRLLAGGTIDAYQTSALPADRQAAAQSTLATDTYQLVFNTALDPAPDAAPRLGANLECRNAFANSTDPVALGSEPSLAATGPFGPDQLGYLEVAALDTLADPAPLFAACFASQAISPAELTILTSADPTAVRLAEGLQSQWESIANGLLTVTIEYVEPNELGERAFLGDFDTVLWRNSGGIHPEASFPWWHSSASLPLGTIALNTGRFADQAIDEALKKLRVDPLPLAQQLAAQEITRSFDRRDWILWLEWTEWSVVDGPNVHDLGASATPEELEMAPLIAGAHWMAETWCDDSVCN